MGEWSTLPTAPVLKGGCPVSFDCRLVIWPPGLLGTHTIYIGEIVDLVFPAGATPLLYADGASCMSTRPRRRPGRREAAAASFRRTHFLAPQPA
jgi:flavin reductase (DIM6/NTAB) family NADH-FMN oxidoreductase RutF